MEVMEGTDQTLYNKLFFRKVSLVECETELNSRKIEFSSDYSLYILTLRLRKQILMKSMTQAKVVEDVSKELEEYEKCKRKKKTIYQCCLTGCKFTCLHHKKYLTHLELVHHNSKTKFTCNYRHTCAREFQTISMLKSHIKRDHEKIRQSSVAISQSQLVQELTKLQCSEKSCGNERFSTILQLKLHLKTHTDRKEETQCCFCDYKTINSGTLKSHMSRKHPVQTVNLLDSRFIVEMLEEEAEEVLGESVCERVLETSGGENNIEYEIEEVSEEHALFEGLDEVLDSSDDAEEIFIKAVAIMVIKKLNLLLLSEEICFFFS